jgi:hypothetical protein
MAKKARTAKARKQPAAQRKAKQVAKATLAATAPVSARGLVASTHPALADAKRAVVVGCVNSFMDQNRPGWNADLHGDSRKMGQDYHYPPKSIPVVLGAIRDCLRTKHYTFTITNDLVQTCAMGTLADLKYAIYQVAATI